MQKIILVMMALAVAGLAVASSLKHVVLDVQNMTCPACTLTIETALDKVPGVTTRQVDAKAATVTVDFDADLTSIPAVVRAISDAGFPAKARPSDG